jgi:16S rRNA (cytosine1402-N4)-methyltransferase
VTDPQHIHIPVLLQETLQVLAPRPDGRYIDATLGGGGHAEAILEASSPTGRLLGLDTDPRAIERVQRRLERFGQRVTLVQSNFRHIADVAREQAFTQVDGILFDLGLSSYHLDEADQGFSFSKEGPLDMRMDPTSGPSAADILNTLDADELADILYTYGEERRSRRIARAIVANRPVTTTTQLADIVVGAIGRKPGARLHPATRTFQALRIYVNDELGALEEALPQALSLLKPGGVLAVITFHSLEDRIVKHYFRQESRDCICPPHTPICTCGHRAQIKEIHRKGLTPSPDEIIRNPRSRSARLRAVRKL